MFSLLALFIFCFDGKIVIDVGVDFYEAEQLLELVNSDYLIKQTINNATFYLTLNQYDLPKYIFMEIYFSYPTNGDVNFITTIGKNQLTSLQNSTYITNYADYNGYQGRKDYHYIVIPANSFQITDTFFITNLIRNDRRQYQYNLKIQKLEYYPCPKNCSLDSGTCVNGICLCNENKIDLDCSKDALALKFDQMIDNYTLQGVQYFYFQQTTKLEKIQLEMGFSENFHQDNASVTLYYMFENFIYGVPYEIDENYTISKDERTINIIIDISQLSYNANLLRFNRLLFKVITKQESQLYIEISDNSSNNPPIDAINILIIVLVSLSTAFFILIIGCIIRKYKQNRSRNTAVIPLCLSESSNYITIDFLKQYMKKAQEGNNQCSICLHSDNAKELIITPCQHPFHTSCLFQWINNRKEETTCPYCRGELDFEQIKMNSFKFNTPKRLIHSVNQSTFNLNQEQAQN
ncbi:unnamed protein product [Paramecium pentaurelia]|uniref:RING-type domain-containing protein n=1 Tax=Paramecium pentaurelia TaxID=43138 RepID=A0A8S1SWB1_9CILI|nr:unnamed protein product [Paramecium pentaurelia]